MNKPFEAPIKYGKTKAGPKLLTQLAVPNRNAPEKEAQMAVEARISPCGDSANDFVSDTWKSIGVLARDLAEKAKAGAQ